MDSALLSFCAVVSMICLYNCQQYLKQILAEAKKSNEIAFGTNQRMVQLVDHEDNKVLLRDKMHVQSS
jgi:hypothetical protein